MTRQRTGKDILRQGWVVHPSLVRLCSILARPESPHACSLVSPGYRAGPQPRGVKTNSTWRIPHRILTETPLRYIYRTCRRFEPHYLCPAMYSRRYKSKSQRPCDFCRRRRSACRIVRAPPCELCKSHGRECTFADAPPPRKKASPAASTDLSGAGGPVFHSGPVPVLAPGIADMVGGLWAEDYLSHDVMDGMVSTPDSTLMASYLAAYDDRNDPLCLEEGSGDRNKGTAVEMQTESAAGPRHGGQRELISRSNSVLGATDPRKSTWSTWPHASQSCQLTSTHSGSVPYESVQIRL